MHKIKTLDDLCEYISVENADLPISDINSEENNVKCEEGIRKQYAMQLEIPEIDLIEIYFLTRELETDAVTWVTHKMTFDDKENAVYPELYGSQDEVHRLYVLYDKVIYRYSNFVELNKSENKVLTIDEFHSLKVRLDNSSDLIFKK